MLENKTISTRTLFAIGCLMGASIFLLLFTAASLNVTDDSWIITGFLEKDLTQHYTGWLFLRDSEITFPLGMSYLFNYPYGSAVTFTDSIPLFAIFFRFFEVILPETFQYFGLFSLLAYTLQGGAAMLLLSLFTQKLPALLCGTALLIANPILIERTFRHTALSAHCLIVFALYLYFKNKKEGFSFRKGYLVLLGVSVAIHPYFTPMLFGILFADLLEHCIAAKRLWKPLGFLCCTFAVVLGVGGCIGIFSVPSSGDILVGYGYFGMNLNSLWTPVSTGNLIWSSVLPTQNQGLGTVEGFNYLGLAVLFAAPLCALYFVCRHKWAGVLAALKKHYALVFVCGCLTIFAISNTWVANIRVLFTIPLPATLQSLCNTFRASGRMFWPVYYIIYLFVIVTIAQLPKLKVRKPSAVQETAQTTDNTVPTLAVAPSGQKLCKSLPLGCILLAVVLVVQVADMRGVLQEKHSFFSDPTPTFENEITDPIWDEIATCYDHLYSLDDYLYGATDVAYYAASSGLTTNDGWAARFDYVTHRIDVLGEMERIKEGVFSEGTFYLTSDENTFIELAAATEGLAHAVRINNNWFAILPIVDGLSEPVASGTLSVYPLIPLTIPDYSDDDFTNGVSNTDPATIVFDWNDFTARYLTECTVLYDQYGNSYDITAFAYTEYYERAIITLDIADASVLKGLLLYTDVNSEIPLY